MIVLRLVCLLLIAAESMICAFASDEFLRVQQGTLPIVISAPHGGSQSIPGAEERKGEALAKGASGFFTGRDTGTEELATELARQLELRFDAKPCFVISRVHRRYVDFNRPPEIAVEHDKARVVYDSYHTALKDQCRIVRSRHSHGLLIDLHGQGTSAETVFRGTANGITTTMLQKDFGTDALFGGESLFGLLNHRGWKVHPDPLDGREQSGFTGGYIVQTYGSHRGDGLDAFQLEFGSSYRSGEARNKTAEVLADAIAEYSAKYLKIPAAAATVK